MTTDEAFYRGNNLVATAIMALTGFAFLPEFFLEDDAPDKIDEAVLFLIGIGAIIWYLMGRNKFSRSLVPVILIGADLVMQIIGLIIEFDDKEAAGDNFGGLILQVLATALVVALYFRGAPTQTGRTMS